MFRTAAPRRRADRRARTTSSSIVVRSSRPASRPNPTIKAAWDNCQPIDYAINVDLADNDAQIQMLIDSIEEIERYTGIDFRYVGVTSAGMNIDDQILLPESFSPKPPYKYLPTMDRRRRRRSRDRVLQPRTTPPTWRVA